MLSPLVALALVADLLLLAVFGLLARAERREYLRLFAIAWAVSAARRLVSLLSTGGLLPDGLEHPLVDLLVGVTTFYIVASVGEFIGRPLRRAWAWALAPALAFSLVADLRGWPFWLGRLPTFLLLGLATVLAGVVLMQARALPRAQRTAVGTVLVLWGLHRVDYPFLRSVPWFAPWGYALATLFGLSLAVGMLLLHFELSRRQRDEANARYRRLFEQTGQGILRGGPAGLTDANPALVKMLGFESEAELLAVTRPESLYVDPEQRRRLLASKAQVLNGLELDWKKKDGTPITVQVWGNAVKGKDGAVDGFEGFVSDVTHLKRLQAELLQAQKMEALGRVAGGVAHDFNNLLTIITSALFMLNKRVGEDGREYVAAIDDAATRAAGLTRQLLAFSRRAPPQSSGTDVVATLRDALPVAERLAGPGCPLEVSLAPGPLPVALDKDQLGQVLLNLVVNARDAQPDGGTIAVRLRRDGDAAELQVEDHGVGMDEATQRRVFEPFFTTKPQGRGTGLGLATVYGLATQAGGTVAVRSAPGQGATFTVRLPLRAAEAVAPRRATPAQPTATGARTLLLVDDDELVLRSTRRVLEGAGYQVEAFSNPTAALAWGRAHGFAALVSDINMPELDGIALAEALAPAPAVLISGDLGAAAARGAALPAGVAFLPKPYQAAHLLDVVKAQLAGAAVPRPPG